eukprot:TRINITY_DN5814_c0_g1_i1.p1 TRINITY_DN5814_c0_g1~~TRINITY_DN5814_c0_g1_i1.p1  ORF type:complete len:557 (+),score=129.76 TRINITY_DN5814_c0_g1_i1:95-1672(+)
MMQKMSKIAFFIFFFVALCQSKGGGGGGRGSSSSSSSYSSSGRGSSSSYSSSYSTSSYSYSSGFYTGYDYGDDGPPALAPGYYHKGEYVSTTSNWGTCDKTCAISTGVSLGSIAALFLFTFLIILAAHHITKRVRKWKRNQEKKVPKKNLEIRQQSTSVELSHIEVKSGVSLKSLYSDNWLGHKYDWNTMETRFFKENPTDNGKAKEEAVSFATNFPIKDELPGQKHLDFIRNQMRSRAWKFTHEVGEWKYWTAVTITDNKVSFLANEVTTVQTNYPFFNAAPSHLDINPEFYYIEFSIRRQRESFVSVGLATKPFPSFQMPGWFRNSVGYHSDGTVSCSEPFESKSFSEPFGIYDQIGVGYYPQTGAIFFTKNGKYLGEAFRGKYNLYFPTVGSNHKDVSAYIGYNNKWNKAQDVGPGGKLSDYARPEPEDGSSSDSESDTDSKASKDSVPIKLNNLGTVEIDMVVKEKETVVKREPSDSDTGSVDTSSAKETKKAQKIQHKDSGSEFESDSVGSDTNSIGSKT